MPVSGGAVLVADEDGQPIPGAQVRILGEPGERAFTTGADGRCAVPFEGGEGGSRQHLHAAAEGYFHAAQWRKSEDCTITLHRLTSLQGRVLEAGTGIPIPGARVGAGEDCGWCELPEAVTDALGRFELEGLPLHEATSVDASAPGFVRGGRNFVLEGDDAPLEVALEPGAALRALVVDAESRLPIEGAEIVCGGAKATTAADGTLVARELVRRGGARTWLSVEAPGYLILSLPVEPRDLASGPPLELPLLRCARVEGVVVGPDGHGVAGVAVPAELENRKPAIPGAGELPSGWKYLWVDPEASVARTDATGRFVLDRLVPGMPAFTVRAVRQGIRADPVRVAVGGPGSSVQVTLRLVPEDVGTVRGRLTLNGNPLAGAVEWRGSTRSGADSCDESGSFEITDVEAGPVILVPHPPRGGRGPCSAFFRETWPVEVPARGVVTQDLELQAAMAPIRGRVLDGQRAPVAGMVVHANAKEACLEGSATTDAEGRFTLEVQPDVEAYLVWVDLGPSQQVLAGIAPGTEGLEIVLQRLADLTWRAIDPGSGSPVDGSLLLWRRVPSKGYQSLWALEEGPDSEGWRTARLPEGLYDLCLESAFRPSFRYGVWVEGAGQRVEFELRLGLELEVRLADGQEPWPNGVVVLLLDDERYADVAGEQKSPFGWLGSWFVRFDAEGRARLGDLAEGRHRFRAFPEQLAIEPAEVVVREGMEPVELRWSYR